MLRNILVLFNKLLLDPANKLKSEITRPKVAD